MSETDRTLESLRSRIRILWMLVAIAFAGLALVGVRHLLRKPESPPAVVRPRIEKPPAEPRRELPVEVIPVVTPATPIRARLAIDEEPQVPVIRHFDEHLSSDGPAENDTTSGWISGPPPIPEGEIAADSVESYVIYPLPNGGMVEYDLTSNRYRVFVMDSLPAANPMEQPNRLNGKRIIRPKSPR